MSKADKMFEDLSYKKIVDDKYRTVCTFYGFVYSGMIGLKKEYAMQIEQFIACFSPEGEENSYE